MKTYNEIVDKFVPQAKSVVDQYMNDLKSSGIKTDDTSWSITITPVDKSVNIWVNDPELMNRGDEFCNFTRSYAFAAEMDGTGIIALSDLQFDITELLQYFDKDIPTGITTSVLMDVLPKIDKNYLLIVNVDNDKVVLDLRVKSAERLDSSYLVQLLRFSSLIPNFKFSMI